MLTRQNQLVLQGAIEVLTQASSILSQITNEQYRTRPDQGTRSSIGEHFRHLIDLFSAVLCSRTSGMVDYDQRSRGAAVERNREIAISNCESLMSSISELDEVLLGKRVELKTEVCLSESLSVVLPSSFQRELVFAAAHAVHHFAIIREIALGLGCELSKDFGLAPATMSFLRSQPECAP